MYWQILLNHDEDWNAVIGLSMSLVILGVSCDTITLPLSVIPHDTNTCVQESSGNDSRASIRALNTPKLNNTFYIVTPSYLSLTTLKSDL